MFNLDTSTGIAFISENSPVRVQLRQHVQGQQMVMTQTAFNELTNIVQNIAGIGARESKSIPLLEWLSFLTIPRREH